MTNHLHKTSALDPGGPAPDFTLRSTPDQRVSLSDFRGRPVILTFYPADWSPVCGDQLALYNELLFENQEELGDSNLIHYASKLGLDATRFESELSGHTHATRVREDFMSGVRSGVNGTPAFFINGVRYRGSFDFDVFLHVLQNQR